MLDSHAPLVTDSIMADGLWTTSLEQLVRTQAVTQAKQTKENSLLKKCVKLSDQDKCRTPNKAVTIFVSRTAYSVTFFVALNGCCLRYEDSPML